MANNKCIMPEMPYCPACPHGYVAYPDDVETYEDTQGCSCEWVCMLDNEEEMLGQESIVDECDGRCLNCDNYDTDDCPDKH